VSGVVDDLKFDLNILIVGFLSLLDIISQHNNGNNNYNNAKYYKCFLKNKQTESGISDRRTNPPEWEVLLQNKIITLGKYIFIHPPVNIRKKILLTSD